MTKPISQVDLTSCDREPIHQLGHIQRFGALIAVTSDWNIAFRSANVDDILGPRTVVEIGDRLSNHFSEPAMRAIREQAETALEMGVTERIFSLDLLRDGRIFDLAVHCAGDYTVLEFEPATTGGSPSLTSILRPIMDRLENTGSTQELCEEAATQLKRLLEFDRVMVYRFHADESGEVIAEAREPHLEPFLNLRYPRTDIPQQARRLYLKNLFRIISDVNEKPVPIEPGHTLSGEPLDLSNSTLRSVSPIHIEYLQNMGVGASLSISIVIGGKLWGLFACHHYSPKRLAFQRRTLAELFSQLFSMQLNLAIVTAGSAVKDRARNLHDRLMTRLMDGEDTLADNIGSIDDAIGTIIPHDGMSAYIEGQYTTRGFAPTEEEFLAIVPALNTSSTSTLVHSDSLAARLPAAEAFADRAVGALIIPVSRRPRDYVVLWRRELKQTVTWAGNPEKVATVGPNGDRLTPRKSFAAWQQSVDGQSTPWREEELAIAESLRVTLLEIILRVTDQQMEERERNQQRQDLLIAELNHRVRNILTLIRSLIGQSQDEARDMKQFAKIVGGRIQALAMAHDQITQEQWSPASLKKLIRSEAEAYLTDKVDHITITGPDALVAPEAYTVLALVMHEMITNSAKYGSLCDSSGTLEIAIEFDRHTDLCIGWRERGGPAVEAPTRRGFGTTIIEKSIPFELKGTAEIRYAVSGVEAQFCIPSKYAEVVEKDGEALVEANETKTIQPHEKLTSEDKRHGVLLVEDSMIIAMDTEEMLAQLGFKRIAVCASVQQALDALAGEEPMFGLLDYNLGNETSDPVARALSERGVPFWFVTGYGDAIDALKESGARGVVQKPYGKDEIERIVGELQGVC
ncbi:MAG: HWE histidine kinase domain-containing protein [Alteraurantiacibacter sp.]